MSFYEDQLEGLAKAKRMRRERAREGYYSSEPLPSLSTLAEEEQEEQGLGYYEEEQESVSFEELAGGVHPLSTNTPSPHTNQPLFLS